MPEIPKRKYLIGGAVTLTLVIVITVLLVTLLPPESEKDGSSTTPIPTTTSIPTTTDHPPTGLPVPDTAMIQMLDAMQRLMTGEGEYDREYYTELRSCMDKFDSRLQDAQDGAWQGMIDYWNSNGVDGDNWGDTGTVYMEQNPTVSDFLGMVIYEPCNYASNVAYYHDVTEFCRRQESGDSPVDLGKEYIEGLGKAFSTLGFGSSFMHGSHTKLGGQQDTNPIKVIALLIHQGSLAALPEPPSTILTDLDQTPMQYTALELADQFVNMHLNMDVTEWYEHTNSLAIPRYELIFSGLFSTVLTIVYPPELVDEWVPKLSGAFGVPEEDTEFIMNYYLPEIRNATEFLNLTEEEKNDFEIDAWTTVFKLVYAFLWQEEVLTDNPLFKNETVNEIGWQLLPLFNKKMNDLNSFEYYEKNFQRGVDIYPGDADCNPHGPHAKWHLESGLGLLDLTYLGDKMVKIFNGNDS